MRICTITCHDVANFGASLQAHALLRHLGTLGHDVRVIDYKPPYLVSPDRLWVTRRGAGPAFNLVHNALYLPIRLRAWRAYRAFNARYLRLTRRYGSLAELASDPPAADAYVCGSDQIWNSVLPNGRDGAFYLRFGAPGTRRVAYAASFGVPRIDPETQALTRGWLQGLDALSVREPSGAAILADLGISDVPTVVDPVLLLDRGYWEALGDEPVPRGDYLLVYDFARDEPIRRAALALARTRGWKVIYVGTFLGRPRGADRYYVGAAPGTFLSLLRRARLVLTNSYHATLFAMILHVPLLMFERADGHNARMTEFLGALGLAGCVVPRGDVAAGPRVPEVDWTRTDAALARRRSESEAYLVAALAGRRP